MIGQRLKLARAAAGMSLRDLSSAMDGLVTAQAIGKYERNEAQPGSRVLIGLAKALSVSIDYLTGDRAVEIKDVDFRKDAITSSKEESQVQAQAVHLLERYLMVEQLLDLPSLDHPFPESAKVLVKSLDEAEEAAQKVRADWDLGDEPVPNLVEALEEQGIKILALRLAKVDGLLADVALNNKDSVPLIVLNNQAWGERQRFTLAHELGHMVLKVAAGVDGENAAHRFAGAFLMPLSKLEAEVGRHRTSIGWPELYEIKKRFGASLQAIVFRCHELGVFPPTLYRKLYRDIAKQGWRKPPYEEPFAMAPERPFRFFRLCFRALAEGAISEAKAAELLGLSVASLNRVMDDPSAANILKDLGL